jgi:hypothetical protein
MSPGLASFLVVAPRLGTWIPYLLLSLEMSQGLASYIPPITFLVVAWNPYLLLCFFFTQDEPVLSLIYTTDRISGRGSVDRHVDSLSYLSCSLSEQHFFFFFFFLVLFLYFLPSPLFDVHTTMVSLGDHRLHIYNYTSSNKLHGHEIFNNTKIFSRFLSLTKNFQYYYYFFFLDDFMEKFELLVVMY